MIREGTLAMKTIRSISTIRAVAARPLGLLRAFFFVALLGLSPTSATAAVSAPEPETDQWARSSLALLRFNRQICQDIAADVLNYWQQLPAGEEQKIRDFALRDGGSDLAAARAAGDLIHRFEKGTRVEAGATISGSLRKLYELQIELCDTVAFPRAPRHDFAATIDRLGRSIQLEEQELGLHLVTDPEQLEQLLDAFLLPIQLAGIEAEGEYADYIDRNTPKPKPRTVTDLMRVWYKTYAPAVAPAKQALGSFLRGRQQGNPKAIAAACRTLSAEVLKVLDNERLFRSIDPAVNRSLRRSYADLKLLAGQCVVGRFDQVDRQLTEVQRNLRQAARALARYELRP